MNKSQKIIVLNCFLTIFMLIGFVIFDDWITSNWYVLESLLFVILLINVVAFQKKYASREGGSQLNRIVEENSWIKIYLAIYGIVIAIGTNYILFNNINISEEVGEFEVLIAIFLLFLPMFTIRLKEAYIKAGKET